MGFVYKSYIYAYLYVDAYIWVYMSQHWVSRKGAIFCPGQVNNIVHEPVGSVKWLLLHNDNSFLNAGYRRPMLCHRGRPFAFAVCEIFCCDFPWCLWLSIHRYSFPGCTVPPFALFSCLANIPIFFKVFTVNNSCHFSIQPCSLFHAFPSSQLVGTIAICASNTGS